ncbi:MAG: hypothetical protein PWQ82_1655 [Thermosediminibacterales bacterium]|nr:hypothetical protein [Thermosediminibacterales bacterium]MDK2836150.1 hypothetical protein [Thermosediminibacterales bacterium]
MMPEVHASGIIEYDTSGGSKMAKVGIIANPQSGKDIRRLVAHGTVIDNLEKVNIVKRLILGLEAVGIEEVVIMPDTFCIGERAIEDLGKKYSLKTKTSVLEMRIEGSQEDSQKAAKIMAEEDVGCIITLGGDGTNRVVARGCGRVPIAPVSTGTNNVFPTMMEGTIMGLAAGVVARRLVRLDEVCFQSKRLSIIKNKKEVDSAFVDVVVCKDVFVGSRAIWDMNKIFRIVTTRGEPTNIGMSAIGGFFHPISVFEDKGHSIKIGKGNLKVKAPISPGIVEWVDVEKFEVISVGDSVRVLQKPSILALDGEREVEVSENDEVSIRLLRDGPLVVDVNKVMNAAVNKGFFTA